MEHKRKSPLIYEPKVREIQEMLNKALRIAFNIVEEERSYPKMLNKPHYFQLIHHRDYISNDWKIIAEDGYFGEETEKTVKCFQRFLYITENGIVGDYTYSHLKKILSLNPYKSILFGDKINESSKFKIKEIIIESHDYLCNLFINHWNNEIAPPSEATLFFIGKGFIVFLENHENLTLHVNLNKIINDLLLPEHSRKGKWFHINNKSIYRQFKAFRISKHISRYENVINNRITPKFGITGCLIETVDIIGHTVKGELKFVDLAKWGTDSLNLINDFVFKNVNTFKLTIGQSVTQYGNAIAKWRYAAKLPVGGVVVTGGVAVVCLQCVGALWTGIEFGNWLEKKTHWGEKSINFLWELFLGDIIEKFIEWRVNRIVCIKYPDDWTEEQIKDFQSRFK